MRRAARPLVLVDQALSSVSNILAVVLVARVLDAADFGHFVLGYSILTLTLAVSRGLFGTRISMAADHDSARAVTGRLVTGVVLISPLLTGAVLLVAGLATAGSSLLILAIVACATPVVCLQDLLRFGAVAAGRPVVAAVSDGVWVLIMAVPFVLGSDVPPAAGLLLWWGAALTALVIAWAGLGVRASVRDGAAELVRREPLGLSVSLGSIIAMLATLWILFCVTWVIGPATAGSLRGAATAMGPVNVLIAFAALGLTPSLVRRRRHGDLAFCGSVALVLAAATLAWGFVLLLLPAAAGTAAFGQSWEGIRTVLPWTLLEYVTLSVAAAATLGLKVRRRPGQLVRQRLAAAVVTVAGGTSVALVTGRIWAVAAALAAAGVVSALAGWVQLLRSPERTESVPVPVRRRADEIPVGSDIGGVTT